MFGLLNRFSGVREIVRHAGAVRYAIKYGILKSDKGIDPLLRNSLANISAVGIQLSAKQVAGINSLV